MTEYMTEQEQIEILKNWIKQYGLVIVTGVVIALITVSGWRYWQQRQQKMLSHASSVYDEMLAMRAQNNPTATYVQAKKLFAHYPKTIYSQMAALMLTRDAVVKKNYNQAENHLEWILKNAHVSAFKQIARLRLARVYLAEHKPQESINILETIDDHSFVGLINEVRGDAFLAMKNKTKARQYYQLALNALPNAETIRPLLQMKYDNLS